MDKKLIRLLEGSLVGDILKELAAIPPEEYIEPIQEVRPECDMGEMVGLEKAAFTWIYKTHERIQKQAGSMSGADTSKELIRISLVESALVTNVRLRLPEARTLGIGFGKGFRVIRDHDDCDCRGCCAKRDAQKRKPSVTVISIPWQGDLMGEV